MNSSIGPLEVIGTVTGTVALILSFLESRATRHHNRLSVQPHLQWESHYDWNDQTGLTYRYVVQNYGLGPAVLKKIDFLLNEEIFTPKGDDPVHELVEKLIGNSIPVKIQRTSFLKPNYVLKPQHDYLFAELNFPSLMKSEKAKLESFGKVRIKIDYESFYGDKYVLES